MLNMLNQNRKTRNTQKTKETEITPIRANSKKITTPHKKIYESAQICAKNKRNIHVRSRKLARKIGMRLKKDKHMRENSAQDNNLKKFERNKNKKKAFH